MRLNKLLNFRIELWSTVCAGCAAAIGDGEEEAGLIGGWQVDDPPAIADADQRADLQFAVLAVGFGDGDYVFVHNQIFIGLVSAARNDTGAWRTEVNPASLVGNLRLAASVFLKAGFRGLDSRHDLVRELFLQT